jgi:hypothetical protein
LKQKSNLTEELKKNFTLLEKKDITRQLKTLCLLIFYQKLKNGTQKVENISKKLLN